MKPFTIKASKPGIPTVDCTWHLEAETKEEAQAMFKVLMPGYEVSKVKSKNQQAPPRPQRAGRRAAGGSAWRR